MKYKVKFDYTWRVNGNCLCWIIVKKKDPSNALRVFPLAPDPHYTFDKELAVSVCRVMNRKK